MEFISTRPGRIDKAIELTYLEPDDKRRMAERILAEYPEALEEILDFIAVTQLAETPAQFQERCAQIALRHFWEEQARAAVGRKDRMARREEIIAGYRI